MSGVSVIPGVLKRGVTIAVVDNVMYRSGVHCLVNLSVRHFGRRFMRVTVDDGGFHGHVSEAAGRFGADLTETFGGRLAGVSCVSRFHGHVSEAAGRFEADLTETFGGRLATLSLSLLIGTVATNTRPSVCRAESGLLFA